MDRHLVREQANAAYVALTASGPSVLRVDRFNGRATLLDGVVAGVVAAVASGAPSTLHALVTGADPREATLAAGTILLPRETSPWRLAAAGAVTHLGLSLAWGTALAVVLPRRRPWLAGAVAGCAIAVLDLGLGGPRRPRIRALPRGPQLADHLFFGLIVGAVAGGRRSRRARRAAVDVAAPGSRNRTRAMPASRAAGPGHAGP